MRVLIVALAALLATASAATAQPALTRFEELPLRLKLGDNVAVVDMAGKTWRGHVLKLEPDAIVLDRDAVTFNRARVQRIGRCCDPLGNGIFIGAAGGVAFGVWFVNSFIGPVKPTDVVISGVVFGGAGAAAGVAIDLLIRRDVTVYRAASLSVSVGAIGSGPGVVVRW